MICGVTILTKNRNDYLPFFIDYYLNKLKFDIILILDNNKTNHFKYNDPRVFIFKDDSRITLSTQCFYFYKLIKKAKELNIDYLLQIDDDEFLNIGEYTDIHNFIKDQMINKNYDVLYFIWKCYSDNNIVFNKDLPFEKGNVINNFPTPVKYKFEGYYNQYGKEAFWTKYIFNLHIIKNDNDINRFQVHDIWGNDTFKFNLKVINDYDEYEKYHIKHYRTKNFEEYLLNKINDSIYWSIQFYADHSLFDNYFILNEKNDFKIQQIIECYKKYNIPINFKNCIKNI